MTFLLRPYSLLALALAAFYFASSSFAATRAESTQECGIAADMAVVAQSLAREEIAPAKAGAIMARIYDVSESERGRALMKEILDTAYVQSAAAGGTRSFAEELFTACMATDGNMDSILGRRL